jgi:hypothetical protein
MASTALNFVELSQNTMPCFSPNKISWNFETRWRNIRASLFAAADSQPSSNHLQQRLVTTQLEDQFSYLVRRHTDPTGFNPLPEREGKQALVRFMQAIYSGRGCIATAGRTLTSFYIDMSPFYTHLGGGAVGGPFSVFISGKGIMNWCQ